MFDTDNLTNAKIDLHLSKAVKKALPSDGFHTVPTGEHSEYTYTRRTPLCFFDGQPIADGQEAEFRTDRGDVLACKQCLMSLQSETWKLLEAEGKGDTSRVFGENELPAEETQITPYVVADLDKITPMAEPGAVRKDQPQTVHNPVKG